jgi:OOP family OmpA-OmpF porin
MAHPGCSILCLVIAAALAASPQKARATSCVAGPFMIFFDRGSDRLTPSARTIIGHVLQAYPSCGGGSVLLAGHSDRMGPERYNQRLSARRAERVRAYLAAHGIREQDLASAALGESRPLVGTADEVEEARNRRVEISFGPSDGW